MSFIEKIKIVNYKCFKGEFTLMLNHGINIIVGNNEAGKSTILEAIHLALSGLLNGRYLRNELSQDVFNKEIEKEYLESIKSANPQKPPSILIEVFFAGDDFPVLEGDGNSERKKGCGVRFTIEFDTEYHNEYSELVKTEFTTIPIEFFKVTLSSFAREKITTKIIPLKSVLIDSSSTRYQNSSDVYISRIIKDDLDDKDIVQLSQAYRKLKESFMLDSSIEALNKKISDKVDISDKDIKISVDLSIKNSWETILMTYLEDIPFHQIGKGEQCLIKTNLALAHKKAKESNLILMEEPENHLSHTKLNQFIKCISEKCKGKQIIITTHNSFVANKLGLENLILLNDKKEIRLSNLEGETFDFFKKLPGYETLRLILCNKAILVEGASDELIVQKAFMEKNEGCLPIEKGFDVISVGLSFKRFLMIADIIKKPVAVVTDNDGNFESNITNKYKDYKISETIKIFADNRNNLNTLEPQIVDANKNDLVLICEILGVNKKKYNTAQLISDYMINNKTESALKFFSSEKSIMYPNYINDVVDWCND